MPSLRRLIARSGAGRDGRREFRTYRRRWVGHRLRVDSIRRISNIAIELPLDELYERVDVAPSGTNATAAD
jgi:hypothetical protein